MEKPEIIEKLSGFLKRALADKDVEITPDAEFVSDLPGMLADVFKQFCLVTGGKKAQVDLGHRQITGNAHLCNCDHCIAEQVATFTLENVPNVTLDQSRNFALSGGFHDAKIIESVQCCP